MTAVQAVSRPRVATSAAPARRPFPWRLLLRVLEMLIILVYCLFPFYWMIVSSLRPSADIFNNSLIPTHATLENFEVLFGSQNNFAYALRNSVIIAGITTLIALLIAVLAAYALARLRFRRKQLVLGIVVACSMFPGIALLTPLFQLFATLGWINQYQAMILPNISFALPLGIYTLAAFFLELPWELEEAAQTDGASRAQAFRKVLLPLAAPGVFTTTIIIFVAAWNEYLIASAMSIDLASEPVTVAIAKFAGASEFQQPYGTQMAAGVIVTVPLVVLVLAMQRRIISGLTAGGVKT